MNLNITIDWKTITAIGGAGVAWILANKMDKEEAKEILIGMVSSLKSKTSYKEITN